jgi:hypothetical protein
MRRQVVRGARGLDQAESGVRMDLASVKAKDVEQGSKRRPSVFWLARRKMKSKANQPIETCLFLRKVIKFENKTLASTRGGCV